MSDEECNIEYCGTDDYGRTMLKTPHGVDKAFPLEAIAAEDIQRAFDQGVLDADGLTERDERILLEKGFLWVANA